MRDHFRLGFLDPAALIEATETFYEYPNCDRDPLPRWSFGRVTLLGDAAHPDVSGRQQRCEPGDHRCAVSRATLQGRVIGPGRPSPPMTPNAGRPWRRSCVANRAGGPEGVIDLIEARAPDGFDDIDRVASHAEREAVVRGYASMAGFTRLSNAGLSFMKA